MITLEINGTRYIDFLSINVERSIENVYGTFNFMATFGINDPFPIKVGDSCKILVNETAIITGFVELIDINYSSSQHTVSCQGRDNTCDIYDSKVDGDIEFKPPVSLTHIINQVINKLGISNMSVVNEAGTIDPFMQKDIVSARLAQTAFNFIENYARKRQVFVTGDGQGNIVLARGSSQTISLGGVYNQIGNIDNRNNILSSSVKYDNTKRFHIYRCKSQGNPVVLSLTGDIQPQDVVERTTVNTSTISNFKIHSVI